VAVLNADDGLIDWGLRPTRHNIGNIGYVAVGRAAGSVLKTKQNPTTEQHKGTY